VAIRRPSPGRALGEGRHDHLGNFQTALLGRITPASTSVKYEEVYLRAYDNVSEARASIGRYLDFYNQRRPHSSLDGITPDQAYFTPLPLRLAA
jgi:putative transposase